jgi:hypothetical protein
MTQGTKLDRSKDIWDKYRPAGGNPEDRYGIYYLKNSNVTGNSSGNIMCTFLGQSYTGQIGYTPSTIGSGNYFLNIFSAGTAVGSGNISCITAGQNHTIGSGNYYVGLFGSDNTVGNSIYASFVFGQTNTLGSTSNYNAIFGTSNLVDSASTNNMIFGISNIIANANYMNLIFGENNSFASSNINNVLIGSDNDFSSINAINNNCLFGSSLVLDSSVSGTLTRTTVFGDAHSLYSANIDSVFLSGYGHYIVGGNGPKYSSVFGYQNYLDGSAGPSLGQCSFTTGKFSKQNKYACHINSGGHPTLSTIATDDMDEDCGAGQNIGMIPHSGETTSSGWHQIYMDGGIGSQGYTLDENKATLIVTYVVATADACARTKAWRVETLATRAIGGGVTVVSTSTTAIAATSVGGESQWNVRAAASGNDIIIEVTAGSVIPTTWQCYSFGPEIISTEEYIEA